MPKGVALTETALAAVDGPPGSAALEAALEDRAPSGARPNPAEAPPAPARSDLRPPDRRRTSGAAELRRAVLLGLLLAAAIVGLALFLRPTVGETKPAPAAAAAVPSAVASGPVPAPPQAVAAASTPLREAVARLRFDPGLSAARRDAMGAAVGGAGFGAVELLPMPVPIERSRIEYFAPADRAAAEALARALAPTTGGLIETRDLADVGAAVAAGRIDVWLAAEPAP